MRDVVISFYNGKYDALLMGYVILDGFGEPTSLKLGSLEVP